jgi:hypothetical protein
MTKDKSALDPFRKKKRVSNRFIGPIPHFLVHGLRFATEIPHYR